VLRELPMLGPGAGRVKAKPRLGAIFLCLAVASGCFWRSYPQHLRTHSELLVSFARKGRDLVATGRFTAENLPELTYPLERAAAFAADVRRRTDAPPPSLVALERLIERYRTFVQQVDRERHERAGPADLASLEAAVTEVEAASRDVAAALERERISSGATG
jgi:Xaa-Pro aminopeptidase